MNSKKKEKITVNVKKIFGKNTFYERQMFEYSLSLYN